MATIPGSFYGDPSEYLIAALLPSYSERQNSSLIYMMNGLIEESRNRNSGFYNDNSKDLIRNLKLAKDSGQKRLLLGVSFALLDLANNFPADLSGTIVMETGGMKGMSVMFFIPLTVLPRLEINCL